VLGRHVRDGGVLTLEDALARMTILPARRLESFAPAFAQKGRLAVGADADVTVFDAATVLDRATYGDPYQPSAGIVHVLVAGQLVVEGGEPTGAFPGRRLLAPKGRPDR